MFGSGQPIIVFRGPFGALVEINGSIVFLALLFLGLGATGSTDALIEGLVLFVMVIVSIVLHEFGHAWAANVQGVSVKRVVIHGGGGFCQTGPRTSHQAEFIVAMGPLVNVALWACASLGAWWLAMRVSANGIANFDMEFVSWVYRYLQTFALINLILFILNLVPVQPLDGGKLLHLGLRRLLPNSAALRIAGAIGLVFALIWVPAMLIVYFYFGWMLLFIPPILVHWKMAKGES